MNTIPHQFMQQILSRTDKFRRFLRTMVGLSLVLSVGGDGTMATLAAETPNVIQNGALQVGDWQRTYFYYVPIESVNPALVMVFHGGGIDAEKMRQITGYEFERLADEHGFIVVYPSGYQKSWNGCRKDAPYPANRENIDDPAFVRELIAHFQTEYAVDAARVFAMGFSNGGHLVYRLALEMPDEIAAIAAIGANLPVKESCDCEYTHQSIPVMIVNGDRDPVNPFEGGTVKLPDGANLGTVLSSEQTADYFGSLAKHTGKPVVHRYPNADSTDGCTVERFSWRRDSIPEITLLKVRGGGHTIPQDKFEFPAQYGATNRDINSLEEIWKFFARQILKE